MPLCFSKPKIYSFPYTLHNARFFPCAFSRKTLSLHLQHLPILPGPAGELSPMTLADNDLALLSVPPEQDWGEFTACTG